MDIWFSGHLLFDLSDFFALTHLDLSGCRDQSYFMSKLGTYVRIANKQLKLQHLAIHLGWLYEDKRGSFDSYFGDVIDSCPDLRSLDLTWIGPLPPRSLEGLLLRICTGAAVGSPELYAPSR